MATKPMRRINIIGHQNPDTDSICSALAYAWLKNRGSLEGLYEARRARAYQPRDSLCFAAFRRGAAAPVH